MKTAEELSTLRKELETLNNKLSELNEDELKQVSGGVLPDGAEPGVEFVSPNPLVQPAWMSGPLKYKSGI